MLSLPEASKVYVCLEAIGRKNFLFANSVAGANAIEVLCSLVQTCKQHQVDVYTYFRYVLSQIQLCTSK